MPNIKIFTAKNVQRYGFTDGEIDELNAEWERKAAALGLEEYLPGYWQEARRHMSKKLEGLVPVSREEIGIAQPDGEPVELPSLDVNLDDLDIVGEDEIPVVALSAEDTAVDAVLLGELPELESISVDDFNLEAFPAGQGIAVEQRAGEQKAAEGFAAAEARESEVQETAQEQPIPAAERAEATTAEEKIVPPGVPELPPEDTARRPEAAAEEPVREVIADKEAAPVEEQKKESLFGRILARLKKLF